ncbi:ribonuclease like 4 precursor [Danio rerio]|uniref:RNase 3 n=1 Tax=Danio rerio TaxID=7955 RepID=A5HAK2_DANRE|nr:ribonuclease like 4 precursor [Danio rerio]ABQ23785.1 RNase 3 [Danio rerio]|eukprot:NP_001093574.1 ribonuclease like 4 precursor [Danio rerio]
MKTRQSFIILLLVICASLAVNSQSYNDFKRKHLAPAGMKEDDCTTLIVTERKIKEKNQCKKINTFILETEDKIKGVCNTPATDGKNHKGTGFTVINCTKIENIIDCKYNGVKRTTDIILTCENRLPVHYGRSNNS